MTRAEYAAAEDPLWAHGGPTITLPAFEDLDRGGIVGAVDILDCVSASASPWFCGPLGFVLANATPLPFHPCRGALGFFNVQGCPLP